MNNPFGEQGQDRAYDAADPEQAAKRETENRARREMQRRFEEALLSTVEGRAWIGQVLTDCHTFEKRMSMTGSAAEGAYWDGQREVGIGLMQRFVKASPQNFALMLIEMDQAANG